MNMNRSAMGKFGYIANHLFWGSLFAIDLYALLPVVTPIAKYHQSIKTLFLCMVITGAIGIIATFRTHRTDMQMAENICSGGGAYILVTLGAYQENLVKCLFLCYIVFNVICFAAVFSKKIRRDQFRKAVLNRLHRSILFTKRNTAFLGVMVLILIPLSIRFSESGNLPEDTHYEVAGETVSQFDGTYEVAQAYDDKYKLSNNMDVIKKIRHNEEFQSLSFEEKCEVVEKIAFCEARYLGVPKITLRFDELSDTMLGKYDHSTKIVTINSKPLKDGSLPGGSNEEVLRCVCHEIRHVYQYLLSEMYIDASPEQRNLLAFTSEGVADWIDNFENYYSTNEMSTKEEYILYTLQPVEKDAKAWSEASVKEYFDAIDKEIEKLN